jgi:N-acetylneuraminate synthase/sialic acid synthase
MSQNREITIDGTLVADNQPAYIIADIGHNHAGSMDRLEDMVTTAKASGVNAVKFQTRNPKSLYAPHEYYRESDNKQWMDPVYGIHREKLEWSPEEWKHVFSFCRDIGVTAFSTPFDFRSLDLLFGLDVRAVKIASGDATNLPLIRAAASHGVPLIISTGGTNGREVDEIVETMEKTTTPYALLHCSCIYPAPHDVLNLRAIETLRAAYPGVVSGLSTHDPDVFPTVGAFALGGRIFEHHYTNNRRWKGTDNAFSLTPKMMRGLRSQLDDLLPALGTGAKVPDPREYSYTTERRKSVYWAKDVERGTIIRATDISIQCPGGGLPPKHAETLVGRVANRNVRAGEAVQMVEVEQ